MKIERLQRLQRRIQELYGRAIRAPWSARASACWSKGHARKDAAELAARTDNNRVVNFAGPERLVGSFVDVEITTALPHSLRGRLASPVHRGTRVPASEEQS